MAPAFHRIKRGWQSGLPLVYIFTDAIARLTVWWNEFEPSVEAFVVSASGSGRKQHAIRYCLRDRAVVARHPHKVEVGCAIHPPATNHKNLLDTVFDVGYYPFVWDAARVGIWLE